IAAALHTKLRHNQTRVCVPGMQPPGRVAVYLGGIDTMRALLATTALAAALLISPAHCVQAAEGASFDDTAKFLAGMQPSADSPLTPLTRENNWKAHARHFDEQWKSVDARQLSRVRAWVS